MFIIIPLILIVSSAVGIGYIAWPKIKEIKKTDGLLEIKESIWRLAIPEFFNAWDKIDFHGFKKNVLVDYEKFLRRVKILSLKTDNFINKLLEKNQKKMPGRGQAGTGDFFEKKKADLSGFKAREKKLIVEIAKNPKDKNLYKALGILYAEHKMFSDASEVFKAVLELDSEENESKKWLEKIGKIG